ncbi:MAG TPA: hybrid sensor histidine kinase/response regulator [Isosphaeraceae bacterium]|jgi:signal transduction histidine kinase|nr:hybrid sensor histidine kinase/response regulator [Isosphaeraceae bacterium]
MQHTRPTLLILDDEPEVLRSLYDLFRLDYRVLTFERGAEALQALEKHDPHVILSDQRMPTMTGVEFLRQARRLRPDATRLLLTGYADIKAVIDAINQGAIFRYVTKPWEVDELGTIVRQAVEHRDLIVERQRLVAELKETNARLVEANRLKAAFIEVASHELNTPVAVVLGMAELWKLTQGAAAAPAERGWVERIQAAGKRLASTVERMLKLLRADQFDHPLELKEAELEPLLRKAVADLAPFLEARHQRVDVRIGAGLGAAVVDPAKLGDILTNLLVNAIKFTPDGATIEVAAEPDGADRVCFRVTDPGVGIGPAERRHLFEPFFTGYDTLHHSSGDFQFGKRGIGLGLHLVKTFVELHGGTVDCSSAPNQGSTFGFTLPRRPPLLKTTAKVAG